MKRLSFILCFLLLFNACGGKKATLYHSIDPQPFSVVTANGEYTLPDTIVFVIPDQRILKTIEDFASLLIPRHRIDIVPDGNGDVVYRLRETGLGDGGYIMVVGEDGRISISSESLKGLRLGTDALRQSVILANPGLADDRTVLPFATIEGGIW
ncbi:MAG: hypothetical protein LIO77_09780 [Rikenellaceae bacterium]|nr:hypothetical protein [Rikenellaceae bacterium]